MRRRKCLLCAYFVPNMRLTSELCILKSGAGSVIIDRENARAPALGEDIMIFSKVSEKNRTIIAISLFVLVFAALVVAATYTDLDVSKTLTKGILEEGEYLASDTFGVAFEIFGSSPVYIIAGFAAALLMMYIWRFFKLRPLREIACAVLLAGVVLAFWLFFNDMFGYIAEHAEMGDTYLENAMTLVAVLCALLAACTVVFALRGMKDDTLRSLMKFVIAFIIMAAVANLLVHIIKEPAGRMRYRAMNSALGATMGGFDNFTEWYKMNGQPDASVLEAYEERYGVSDAFKSFPSGHTCAAGMTYALIMLPDILKMKNKPLRALCWIFPVLFTGLVAVSRIMVGAHYFSDVLFGGTIAFLSMMLAREIVVFKFEHFKCLGKNYVPAIPAETEE